MRNEQSVVIRKVFTAVGAGLLEEALETEGRKGCSPILCAEPVPLEPPFERFDASRVLRGGGEAEPVKITAPEQEYVTLNVYAGEKDILSIAWCETMLRALSVQQDPMAFELFGGEEKVWVRFAVRRDELPGFQAGLLGHFPALPLREIPDPFPDGVPVVNELVPVAPYHRSLTLLGSQGSSPLSLAVLASFIGATDNPNGQHGPRRSKKNPCPRPQP